MSDAKLTQARREAEDSVAAWMLTLELARGKCDFERAAEAQRELRARGVTVKYGKPKREAQNVDA